MSVTMIGLDTAKSVFQVHAVNEAGKAEVRRKLRRGEVVPFFAAQPACTVVLVTCPPRSGPPAMRGRGQTEGN